MAISIATALLFPILSFISLPCFIGMGHSAAAVPSSAAVPSAAAASSASCAAFAAAFSSSVISAPFRDTSVGSDRYVCQPPSARQTQRLDLLREAPASRGKYRRIQPVCDRDPPPRDYSRGRVRPSSALPVPPTPRCFPPASIPPHSLAGVRSYGALAREESYTPTALSELAPYLM